MIVIVVVVVVMKRWLGQANGAEYETHSGQEDLQVNVYHNGTK